MLEQVLTNCCRHCSDWNNGANHIWWEIQHDYVGTDDRIVTLDTCNNAWNTELGGCSTGSEQFYDGLWFRMDPNEGPCPFKDE